MTETILHHTANVILKGPTFSLAQCIRDGYNVKQSFVCALERKKKFPKPFFFFFLTIANHFAALHPSFCQHPNALDLYNPDPQRKVTQTKLLAALTTCQIFNPSCTSSLFCPLTPFWEDLWILNSRKRRGAEQHVKFYGVVKVNVS